MSEVSKAQARSHRVHRNVKLAGTQMRRFATVVCSFTCYEGSEFRNGPFSPTTQRPCTPVGSRFRQLCGHAAGLLSVFRPGVLEIDKKTLSQRFNPGLDTTQIRTKNNLPGEVRFRHQHPPTPCKMWPARLERKVVFFCPTKRKPGLTHAV